MDGVASLANPIGSPLDKVLVGLFRAKSLTGSLEDLMAEPETTTMQRLQVRVWETWGNMMSMLSVHWRPLGGALGGAGDCRLAQSTRVFVSSSLIPAHRALYRVAPLPTDGGF